MKQKSMFSGLKVGSLFLMSGFDDFYIITRRCITTTNAAIFDILTFSKYDGKKEKYDFAFIEADKFLVRGK